METALAAQRRGAGVVGRVGNTVPAELILACGRLPILVAAEPGTRTPTADVYMEALIAPETRSLFELAVDGRYAAFDLLVLSRPYTQLYYYLKEVYRLGRAPHVPALHMYDLMQSQRDAVRAYNWGQTQVLLERFQRLADHTITDDALHAATVVTNRVRALQRDLQERRWRAQVSGTEALQVIGAGYFMPPEMYAESLATYMEELRPEPGLVGRPRLLVLPSEPLGHLRLHQALEDAGALVVAEDDWWGSRAPGADVPLTSSPLEAIFLKYWTDTHTTSVYPAEAREAWFSAHAVRPEVDGVIFYLPPSDHQLGWDYPRLREWLQQRAKPSLLMRADATTDEGQATLIDQARNWLEGLR